MRNPLATRLASQHFKLTILGGAALVPLLSLVYALLMHRPWAKQWPSEVSPFVKVGSLALGACWILLAVGILPALAAGWLRLSPMRWLLGRATLLSRGQGLALALVGTLLLFEVTVVVPALLGGWATKLPFGQIWDICTGFSLPWLVAALWATWRVLRHPAFVVE